MFRKKSSSSSASSESRTLRRPGQALETAAVDGLSGHSTAGIAPLVQSPLPDEQTQSARELSEDERDDEDGGAAIHRPVKRRRRAAAGELEADSAARPLLSDGSPGSASSSLPLVSVASSRSALPDRSSASHQHARFAPKNPEQPQQPPAAGLSSAPSLLLLPSRAAPTASRFGPLRSSGYGRVISRFDYQPDVCVAAGTPVSLADGSSLAIELVQAGDSVLSFDRARNGLVPMPVSSGAVCSGLQDCIELLFSHGAVLTVTADHRILTDAKQWIRAGDLVVGQSHVSVGMLCPQQVKQKEEETLPHPLVAGWLPHQWDQPPRPFSLSRRSGYTGALTLGAACSELCIGQFFSLDSSKRKAEDEVLEDEPPAKMVSLFLPSSPSSLSPSSSLAEQPAGRRKVVYGVRAGGAALPMSRAKLLAARQVGQRLVYDLSVPQLAQADRSFVAAGVVVHNCKDWLECGSCGYGDSCKFLHDRLDYKQGWQLDRDWEEQQRKQEEQRKDDWERRSRGETVALQGEQQEEGDEGEEREGKETGRQPGTRQSRPQVGLPFACFLCRQPFTSPVVTACGHYFDERCALRRYVQSSTCAVCGKETGGSFTVALDLIRQMDENRGSEAAQL